MYMIFQAHFNFVRVLSKANNNESKISHFRFIFRAPLVFAFRSSDVACFETQYA